MKCDFRAWVLVAIFVTATGSGALADEDLTTWESLPDDLQPLAKSASSVSLQKNGAWGYLCSPEKYSDIEVSTSVSIEAPATEFDFFGSTWSAWPDAKFEDRGFEAALMLRAADDGSSGYRIQLSAKYQEIALIRFPDSGYVRTVPCKIEMQTPMRLRAVAAGNSIRVWLDDQEVIRYEDRLEPLMRHGRVAVGASSGAHATFSDLTIQLIEAEPLTHETDHRVHLTARRWLGGRIFVFDQDEPILQLHHEQDPSCFAKLMPGDKPQLTFDSHWGLENQGAFPEARMNWTTPEISGGGETLRATWSARHIHDRFVTKSSLIVGYDDDRGTYTYDIDSELEVLPGEPFPFRYGFDFEHHTPLDPFRWQYLLIRDGQGQMTYRPLSPFDPGTLNDIQPFGGLRVWHGRTDDVHRVSPAVEYRIQPEWVEVRDDQGNKRPRRLNTAVCAAFYDTGVAFEAVTAIPGDKLRVRYRYTGYPSHETKQLLSIARVQDNPRIDPRHHFVFLGDQWPTIRFHSALAMDKPWWGGRPLMSGHNARPSYDFVMEGNLPVLRLGPSSYAASAVGPEKIEPGRYLVSARVKSSNTHGPGGRIELLMLKKPDLDGNSYVRWDAGNIAGETIRYFGNGSFDWREMSFVAEVPDQAAGLALGLGNSGTGEILVSEVRIEPLEDQQTVADMLSSSPPTSPSVKDALWDLRMQERQGLFVYNYGSSAFRMLELANVDWAEDAGRTAIRFGENQPERRDFPLLGILDQCLRNPNQRHNYEPVAHGAYGLGGGPHEQVGPLPGLTLAAWIKPAAEMGKSASYGGKGDILGYGARRFILGLEGQIAPYSLVARINVKDKIESATKLDADRWYHVAMTCTPAGDHWQVRLFVDGQEVGSHVATSLPVDSTINDSLVLGAELFYLHGAYYRGLIGDALVVSRAMTDEEIRTLLNPALP